MLKGSEVKESLATLNPNKSAGRDKISAKLLRLASKELAPSLTKIVNGCIENKCWPKEWKRGVFKKDDHKDTKNYRLTNYGTYISLLR